MSRYKTCRKEDCSRYKNHSLLFGKNIFLGYHRCLFSACMDLFWNGEMKSNYSLNDPPNSISRVALISSSSLESFGYTYARIYLLQNITVKEIIMRSQFGRQEHRKYLSTFCQDSSFYIRYSDHDRWWWWWVKRSVGLWADMLSIPIHFYLPVRWGYSGHPRFFRILVHAINNPSLHLNAFFYSQLILWQCFSKQVFRLLEPTVTWLSLSPIF